MLGESYDPTMEKKIFKGKTFVLQGNFKTTDGKFMDHSQIARLIRQHGGDVESGVTNKTKLVVTTVADVKRRPPNIVKAIEMGKARCRIVQWEYIEDSIIRDKKGSPSRQSTNYHEMDRVLKRLGDNKAAKEIYANQFYHECALNNALVDSHLYHLYKDSTGFKYKVAVTHESEKVDKRCRQEAEEKVEKRRIEKWTLMLFESNATPHTYKFGANHYTPGQKTIHYPKHLGDADFSKQFKAFKSFFQEKTSIKWEKRLDGIAVTTLEKATKKGLMKEQGRTEAEDKPVFVYTPPHRDQPRGDMPRGWKDPVQVQLEKEEKAKVIRLAKQEAARKAEIREEKRKAAEMREQKEKTERMMREDEEESQPSDCGWDSVGDDSD